MAVWVCTDDDSEDELSVEEDKDAEVNNTATAAAAAAAVGHVTVGARCAAWLRAARCTDVSSLYS